MSDVLVDPRLGFESIIVGRSGSPAITATSWGGPHVRYAPVAAVRLHPATECARGLSPGPRSGASQHDARETPQGERRASDDQPAEPPTLLIIGIAVERGLALGADGYEVSAGYDVFGKLGVTVNPRLKRGGGGDQAPAIGWSGYAGEACTQRIQEAARGTAAERPAVEPAARPGPRRPSYAPARAGSGRDRTRSRLSGMSAGDGR